ncbi:hypothetical protein J6590_023764 [Homalodisca vitripennis]|nr:hypothetical protein J6590_023764 [Homalodisca vitripennis]
MLLRRSTFRIPEILAFTIFSWISDEKRDEGGDYQKSERVVFQQFVTGVRDANSLCGVTCFNNSPANRAASNISLNVSTVCTN